jgi:hypothetical protein
MVDTPVILLAEAFERLGPKNPLRKLSDEDRWLLWGLLIRFVQWRDKPFDYLKTLDRAAETASSAAELAKKMQATFRVDHIEPLNGLLEHFRGVPAVLYLYAEKVESLVNKIGKKGHKQRTVTTASLIEASEFVRLKTRSWNDEHLIELLQFIPDFLSGPEHKSTEAFDGSFIRKRRERFKRDYPAFYNGTVRSLREEQKKRNAVGVDSEQADGRSR